MDPANTATEATHTPVASKDRAQSFRATLMQAAENLVHLQIVTIVGDVELSGDVNHPEIKFPDNTSRSDPRHSHQHQSCR